MDRPIAVVDANKEECQELCAVLEGEDYRTIGLDSLVSLETYMQEGACRVVILDLDTLPVNNRFISDLRKQNPRLPIILLSSRQFHPELQAAMSTDICACLSKPPDPDELIYCLKSFCE